MSNALFADISSYQTVSDWQAYANWSRSGDGVARVVMKATEGVGFKDSAFESFYSGATGAGIDTISVYHYARPDLNPGASGAVNEARWFTSVLGSRILETSWMLDFEQNESAAWAHAWHDAIAWPSGVKPVLYDSVSHFQQFFAGDLALADKFDCALAAWYPLDQGPPAAPQGWVMRWWQYADNESVPGIGVCDANLWLGGASMAPKGPFVGYVAGTDFDDSYSGDALAAAFGITYQDIVAIPSNAWMAGYDPTIPGNFHGHTVYLPGFQKAAGTPKLEYTADTIRAVIA